MSFINRFRYWLLLLPMLGLLVITYWLNQQAQTEPAKLDDSKRHGPDAIVENFSATSLDDQGVPRLIVTAKKMQHFPDDDSATLDLPHFTSLSAERPAIHASAQSGILSSKGDEVFLHGKVELLRVASAQQDKLTLQTEYLHIVPGRDWVSTDRAVTAFDTHYTVHAIGLEMDTKTRTLKLLSQIRSEYVARKK